MKMEITCGSFAKNEPFANGFDIISILVQSGENNPDDPSLGYDPLFDSEGAYVADDGSVIYVPAMYIDKTGSTKWLRFIDPAIRIKSSSKVESFDNKSFKSVFVQLESDSLGIGTGEGFAEIKQEGMQNPLEKAYRFAYADALKTAMKNLGIGLSLDWDALKMELPTFIEQNGRFTEYKGNIYKNGSLFKEGSEPGPKKAPAKIEVEPTLPEEEPVVQEQKEAALDSSSLTEHKEEPVKEKDPTQTAIDFNALMEQFNTSIEEKAEETVAEPTVSKEDPAPKETDSDDSVKESEEEPAVSESDTEDDASEMSLAEAKKVPFTVLDGANDKLKAEAAKGLAMGKINPAIIKVISAPSFRNWENKVPTEVKEAAMVLAKAQ